LFSVCQSTHFPSDLLLSQKQHCSRRRVQSPYCMLTHHCVSSGSRHQWFSMITCEPITIFELKPTKILYTDQHFNHRLFQGSLSVLKKLVEVHPRIAKHSDGDSDGTGTDIRVSGNSSSMNVISLNKKLIYSNFGSLVQNVFQV